MTEQERKQSRSEEPSEEVTETSYTWGKVVVEGLQKLVGDRCYGELLEVVAQRLEHCMRGSDTVARLGGDEFVAILGGLSAPRGCAATARRILKALSEPLTLEGREITVTGSIGIAMFPADGDDPESLLKNADIAMYRAKEQRNRYECYSEIGNP